VAWLSIGITGPHRGVSMAPVTDEDTTVKTYIKRHQP
jgi:hypothetical protein